MSKTCTKCGGSGRESGERSSLTFQSAAKLIREAAKDVREGAKDWEEPDMRAMFISDAKDLRNVAKVLLAGDAKKAYSLAWDMDTAARDHIPQAAYEFMAEY